MQSTSENDLEHWCERATNSQDDGMVGAWTGNPDVIPEADIRFEPDEKARDCPPSRRARWGAPANRASSKLTSRKDFMWPRQVWCTTLKATTA
jgi:hypothetical protein